MSYWIAGAATVGALTNKKDPIKGALMGAAVGATGGAAAGGLMGAGAAGAGGAASAATSAGALAGDAFLPAALGSTGSGAATGLAGLTPSGYTASGLLSGASEYAKPVMQGMQAAQSAQGLMAEPQQPMQAPAQARQNAPLDLSSIFQATQQGQQLDAQEAERRKKELEQYAMNMMGARNG